MSYAVFFDKDNETLRLPVNPEEIKISKAQVIETYNVLKLGKVARAAETELDKYTFEAELPGKLYGYVVTSGDFKPADYYLNKFIQWRDSKEPVRFIKSNGEGDDVSTLVLFESFDTLESAGEEGDYYVSFTLIEYKPHGKKEARMITQVASASVVPQIKVTTKAREGQAPKPKTYTVASGDTLWSIAKRFLGDGAKYREIVKINSQIKNPGLIYVGQVIKLP